MPGKSSTSALNNTQESHWKRTLLHTFVSGQLVAGNLQHRVYKSVCHLGNVLLYLIVCTHTHTHTHTHTTRHAHKHPHTHTHTHDMEQDCILTPTRSKTNTPKK